MNLNAPVSSIMTSPVVSVKTTDHVSHVRKLMDHSPFHHIPVVDENNQVKGMVCRPDMWHYAYKLSIDTSGPTYSRKRYDSLQVFQIMSKQVTSVVRSDPIGKVAAIFKENKFHALPVIENGRLEGIVTLFDVFNFLLAETTEKQLA